MSKVHSNIKQILFYSIIMIYVFLLAKVLLFKYITPFELFSTQRVVNRTVNLIPFKTVYQYMGTNFNVWIAMMNVIGNIVIFIPLGLYLQVFKRNKKILNCVAWVCSISLCVEAVQHIFGIGATDIDDIILNTIGGLLGVLIYKAMYLVLKDEDKAKTAIIFLWCISGMCFMVFVSFITYVAGFKIKLF